MTFRMAQDGHESHEAFEFHRSLEGGHDLTGRLHVSATVVKAVSVTVGADPSSNVSTPLLVSVVLQDENSSWHNVTEWRSVDLRAPAALELEVSAACVSTLGDAFKSEPRTVSKELRWAEEPTSRE